MHTFSARAHLALPVSYLHDLQRATAQQQIAAALGHTDRHSMVGAPAEDAWLA